MPRKNDRRYPSEDLRGTLDTIEDLAEGSIVYQDLDLPVFSGLFEHSGIHVGGSKVASLQGSGEIIEESTRDFLEGGSNRFIWVSCRGSSSVGKRIVAERAQAMVGHERDYNIVWTTAINSHPAA